MKILCSAIYYDDGIRREHQPPNIETGVVVCGLRHCNCLPVLYEMFPGGEYKSNYVQGFLASDGRFVNRQEAYRIADAAGQIVKAHSPGTLFSEDVW